MKRKILYVLAALALISSTAFAAVTASGVQALWHEVNAKAEELRAETLTESQQESLWTIQREFMALGRGEMDSEKLEAFKATLSESQKAAFEELMPAMPTGEPDDGTKPSGTPPERPNGQASGERPAPPTGERPEGAPPARSEGGTGTRPTMAQGEMNATPPQGRGPAMTEEERSAMEAKREAFQKTLSEAQKAAYEEIFPSPAEAPASGQQSGRQEPPQMAAPDLSELTSAELSELNTKLNDLLARLNKIK